MIVINPSTRQFSIPGADLVFGVESDAGSEIKEFQVPRYVGNNLDLAGSFIRINYRNANGEVDSYLVNDATVNGDNVVFTWVLTPKVTLYKGHVSFVVCVIGPDAKVKWHTTLGRGQVLEGLEPEMEVIEAETADVIVQLITMVEAQTAAVETVGETWVKSVKSEGATQVAAVRSAAEVAEAAAVAEIEAKGVNTRATIPEDYTALQNAVDALNRSRGPVIVCEAAGENVVIGDSSNLPIQGLRVFGKTNQVTTTGAQLIPFPYFNGNKTYNGITWAINPDGSVSAKGTATATSPLYFTNSAHELAPGQYTISGSTNGVTVRMDSTSRETGKWKAGVAISKNGQPVTFTITEEDTAAHFYTIYASVENANTVDVTIYPMLNTGGVALPWEIYTGGQPSPSPEYPQELVSLEPVVNVYGKNLIEYPYSNQSMTTNGVTYTPLSDGSIAVSGTSATSGSWYSLNVDHQLPKGHYVLSGVFEGFPDTSALYCYVNDRTASRTLALVNLHKTEVAFTVLEDLDNVGVSMAIPVGETLSGTVKLQLERGFSATAYSSPKPTQSLKLTHTLPGIPVATGGNYTDADGQEWICDEADLERGVYVKRIKSVEFTGDEIGWRHGAFSTDETTTYVFLSDGTIENVHLSICSHAVYSRDTASWIDGKYMRSGGGMWQTMTGMTLDEWKAYAAEQMANGTPITVHYPITVPIETPLSETEIAAYRDLYSNYPNTTVLNDSGAHMVVKYAADTKLYIDNKIKEALQ